MQVTINVRDLNKFAGEGGEISLEMLKESGILNLSTPRRPCVWNDSCHALTRTLTRSSPLLAPQVVAKISSRLRSWEPAS